MRKRLLQLCLIPLTSLSTTAFADSLDSAQTMPFDYFYGRIIGRQQVGVEYRDARLGQSFISTGYHLGFTDRFQFSLPQFLTWSPAKEQLYDPLELSPISASLQLTDFMRIGASAGSLDDGIRRTESTAFSSMRSFHYGAGISLASPGGITYEPDHSLYSYLEQPALSKGDWLLSTGFEVVDHVSRGANRWSTAYDFYESESAWEISSTARIELGISRQLIARANAQVGSSDRSRLSARHRLSDSVSRQLTYDSSIFDVIDEEVSDYTIDADVTGFFSPGCWMTISGSRRRMLRDGSWMHEEYDFLIPDAAGRLTETTSQYTVQELKFKLKWIGQNQPITLRQLLDNYSDYYGEHLSSGTFEFGFTALFRHGLGEDVHYSRDRDEELSQHAESADELDRIYIALNARHHFSSRLYSELTIELDRSRWIPWSQVGSIPDPFFHTQKLGPSLRLSYQNFEWHREQNPEIGWDDVGPIDYLLGPLLRPGHIRFFLILESPYFGFIEERRATDEFFSTQFDKLESEMKISAGFSKGVVEFFQPTIELEFYHFQWPVISPDEGKVYRYSLLTDFRWQIMDFLRVTSILRSVHDVRVRPDSALNPGTSYTTSWELSLSADIVF